MANWLRAYWNWTTSGSKWRLVAGIGGPIVALLVVLAAVSGGSDDPSSPAANSPPSTSQVVNEPRAVTATVGLSTAIARAPDATATQTRCETPTEALVGIIASRLIVFGGGSLRNAQAVKSKDFDQVYFVAADIQGPGLEGSADIAVWAANRLDGTSGLILLTVNNVAKEFSDWPDGARSDAKVAMTDDGAEEARICTQAKA
jgi:hypothetical protein